MSQTMQVAFRCDAGAEVGNGHLIRCLALAQQLRSSGHDTVFLMGAVDLALRDRITTGGHRLVDLADGDPNQQALRELDKVSHSRPIDWLVVDSYAIDARWENQARLFVRAILVIDDLGNRPHDCDVLLDQNVRNRLQASYPTWVPAGCRQLIGPEFLLARDEFYLPNPQTNRRGLLVFLGGGNHAAALDALLDQLASVGDPPAIKVLATSAYSHAERLKEKAERIPGSSFHQDMSDPYPLYQSAHAALVRCGFIAYELALLGVPMLVVYTTAVQQEVALALEADGNAIALPERDLAAAETLQLYLKKLAQLSPVAWNTRLRSGSQRLAELLEETRT